MQGVWDAVEYVGYTVEAVEITLLYMIDEQGAKSKLSAYPLVSSMCTKMDFQKLQDPEFSPG